MPSRIRLKVLITNGPDTRELVWLTAYETQLFAGVGSLSSHTSYHKDGRKHTEFGDRPSPRIHLATQQMIPLKNLAGVEQLMFLAFRPEPCWHSADSAFKQYLGKKYQAGLILDSRKMHSGSVYAVRVGMVGTEQHDALSEHVRQLTNGGKGKWEFVKKYVYEDSDPWIYVLLLRHREISTSNEQSPPEIAGGFVPEPGIAVSGDIRDGGVFHVAHRSLRLQTMRKVVRSHLGEIEGVPASGTKNMPVGSMLYGDLSSAAVVSWGVPVFEVSIFRLRQSTVRHLIDSALRCGVEVSRLVFCRHWSDLTC